MIHPLDGLGASSLSQRLDCFVAVPGTAPRNGKISQEPRAGEEDVSDAAPRSAAALLERPEAKPACKRRTASHDAAMLVDRAGIEPRSGQRPGAREHGRNCRGPAWERGRHGLSGNVRHGCDRLGKRRDRIWENTAAGAMAAIACAQGRGWARRDADYVSREDDGVTGDGGRFVSTLELPARGGCLDRAHEQFVRRVRERDASHGV